MMDFENEKNITIRTDIRNRKLRVSHVRILRLSAFDRASQGKMNLLGSLMGLVSIQAVHGWLSTYERLVNSHPYGILCQRRQGHPQPNSGKSVSMGRRSCKAHS